MVYAVVGGWLALGALVVFTWRRIATDAGWRAFVVVLTLVFSLVHQLLFATVTEDALVTFRYAQNIADGNGPVFNPGDRNEGYANFLWLVVIALPRAAFGADIRTSAVVLGVVAALGSVLLAYVLANRVVRLALPEGAEPQPAIGVAAAVLTAGASGLAVYGPSGTELPMFVLLVLAVANALVARRAVVAGVLVAAAVMTRPEGLVLAVVAGLWLALAAARGRHNWWAPAGYVLGALVFLVPWTAWRATYYHHFLPDSAVRLLGPDWHYLAGFALAHLGFLGPAVAAVVALLVVRTPDRAAEARSALWLLFTLALCFTAFVAVLDGDTGPSWRLLVPVPPLLAVASVGTYGVLAAANPSPKPRTVPRLVPVLAAVFTGFAVLVSVVSPDVLKSVRTWHTDSAQLAEVGEWLAAYLPPGSVVSAAAPGALASGAGSRLLVGSDLMRATVDVPEDGYAKTQHCADDSGAWYRVATFRRIGTPFWISVYPRADEASRLIDYLDRAPDFQYVSCPG
ncbi:hypothetical protein VSH64_38185 [Amycolatopsis rhabdoformis]|uniref:Glycosyltransferase RgtA/B/C/D-like domain-containing protein n=1 Tax=Amycolatopsis rhabdoformis TaxID=1448059 RepID=A0ABZ1I4Q6_9PSEU|nr:hypothetical protein [Amycolatopsis rhabdoformis]WSE28615.1 hypothetical protein VSH64_38185 [Amycolatopsis rhabdoformis]